VEAIGRFTAQSPCCRQGMILAPMAAWQLLPGSGRFRLLGTFWFDDLGVDDLGVAAEDHRRGVTSAHAITTRSDGHEGPGWPQWCIGHGEHGESRRSRRAQRAWQATAARLTRRARRGQVAWIATRPKAGQQRAAQTDVAVRAARGNRIFGRASERFVSERLRRGERWTRRPGPLARRLSGERPATAVTAGTEPVTAGEGSRPLVTAVTLPVTAITATESGQRARFPRRRRPPGQRLSPGRASGTKSTGEAILTARADLHSCCS
jgi:hypothetical protein